MTILTVPLRGPTPSHVTGVANRSSPQSNATSSYSTSPESSRSSKSHISMKASFSASNAQPDLANGASSENTISPIGSGNPRRNQSMLSSRTNDANSRQANPLQRSKTDFDFTTSSGVERREHTAEQNWELRHGWEHQYSSEAYLQGLSSVGLQLVILLMRFLSETC